MILLLRTRERPALCRKNLPVRYDPAAPDQGTTCSLQEKSAGQA